MSSNPKLTKRQKKGIAFRKGKGKSKNQGDLEHDVPILELQDLSDGRASSEEGGEDIQGAQRSDGGERKGRKEAVVQKDGEKEGLVVATKKRKREVAEDAQGAGDLEGEDGPSGKRGVKRTKGDAGDVTEDAEQGESKTEKSKQRFILFLGNLKYTTTLESIEAHFAACDPPPTVRLLAPKPAANKPPSRPVMKSKGCAFLEFRHRNALQQGLKLHHSSLDGRQINVELTAGGGGKGEARLSKLKERNKELESQRQKQLQKKANSKGEEPASRMDAAKRFSTTSGADQEVQKKRTWTVGDTEDSTTHRGGKKHVKADKTRRTKSKHWGTGVNAIPVG
ncbi:RNA binding protein [Suillus tomentosus]|nr:RNA binding protein [Suillus tomentosus]